MRYRDVARAKAQLAIRLALVGWVVASACTRESTVSPEGALDGPEALRSLVTEEVASLLDANGRFLLPQAARTATEISSARAVQLATAFVTTFGRLIVGEWEAQRGLKIDVTRLRACGRVTYALSSYELLEGRSLWAQKLVGSWWLVSLCDGTSPQALIAVSAHNTDVTIDDRGWLVQPPVGGNNFMTRGIPAGESVPVTPEEAVILAGTTTGTRIDRAPEFVSRPRPAAPWLGAWQLHFERPVTVTGIQSNRTSQESTLGVGYGASWEVVLLGRAASVSQRGGDTIADHGYPNQAPQSFFVPFRAGVVQEYEPVRAGGQ
jgi:hypothetical protein